MDHSTQTTQSDRKLIESVDFSNIALFRGLAGPNLDRLKPTLEVLHFDVNEIVFNEGDPGDGYYVIVSGKARAFIRAGKDGAREVARLGRNEAFGETALLTGAPRSASIQALTKLTVIRLSKYQFDEITRKNQFLAVHFTGLLAKRLASTKHEIYEPKLSSKEVHASMTQSGVSKANTKTWQIFFMSVLAGIYISIGGHAYLVALDQGAGKIVGGMIFGTGLVLVNIAEAELFTGNIIMMVGLLSSMYQFKKVAKNLFTVYVGNFVGSILFAVVVFQTGLFVRDGQLSGLGQVAAKIADAKLALSFSEAFVRGIFCNMLVILAIIMAIFAKDIISKILCCVLPIMIFVASGFEHCVANMYLIPIGLLTRGVPLYEQYVMFNNIIPVTLGNIVGGMFIIIIHPMRLQKLLVRLGFTSANGKNLIDGKL